MSNIIQSLLWTDLYKLTMQQAVLSLFPETQVKYKFYCRTPDVDFNRCYEDIEKSLRSLEDIKLKTDEYKYLESLNLFSSEYLEFLEDFNFNYEKNVKLDISREGVLDLTVKGLWVDTILWEVPSLAIINYHYFNSLPQVLQARTRGEKEQRLKDKIGFMEDKYFRFSEFGTRRAFSPDWQKYVVRHLKDKLPKNFIGTSNVKLAQISSITPVGTMAHEWIQCHQVLAPFYNHQQTAFENWLKVYSNNLKTALSDTLCLNQFLKDFNYNLSSDYSGVRHDSGCPFRWGEEMLNHYKKFSISPHNKVLLFSDGLNFEKATKIYNRFKGRINVAFGIGTYLTNDIGTDPISIVMKVIECDGHPVAKISDEPGKNTCEDKTYLEFLKYTFGE